MTEVTSGVWDNGHSESLGVPCRRVCLTQGGMEMPWSECRSWILLSMRSRARVSSSRFGMCGCLQVAEVTLCDLDWDTKGHTSYSLSS